MNTKNILNKLNKIANVLDDTGLYNEANEVTIVMNRVANRFDEDYMDRFDPSNMPDRTPGRSEMFEADLPGEMDEMDSDFDQTSPLFDAIMEEVNKALGMEMDASEMEGVAKHLEGIVQEKLNRMRTDRNVLDDRD
jgi:proteasome assembly chaperone (PAC2) family protein